MCCEPAGCATGASCSRLLPRPTTPRFTTDALAAPAACPFPPAQQQPRCSSPLDSHPLPGVSSQLSEPSPNPLPRILLQTTYATR